MRRFMPGEAIALREIWRERVWSARPLCVVRDDEAGQMFYLPVGTRWIQPTADGGTPLRERRDDWSLTERTWEEHHVLSFAWPDAGHAILLFFDPAWSPVTWYVNVQDPLRRTQLGFDTMDHQLDVVVALDGSAWSWKDEDELERDVRLGNYTTEQTGAFRAEGELGTRRIVEREPPFDRDWTTWRPDPSWPPPTLPRGWNVVVTRS